MPLSVPAPRPLRILALALLAAGCHSSDLTELSYETPAPGIQAGYVAVTPTGDGLVVVNQTERPIYLMAASRDILALLDWLACTGGDRCPALAPGQQRVIPWSLVVGFTPDTKQYTVFWWHVLVLRDGTRRADDVYNVSVTR